MKPGGAGFKKFEFGIMSKVWVKLLGNWGPKSPNPNRVFLYREFGFKFGIFRGVSQGDSLKTGLGKFGILFGFHGLTQAGWVAEQG